MSISQTADGVAGLRVFVVEDEALVAMMLEDMLADLGCVVVDVAGTVTQALNWLNDAQSADAAILDVNIGGEKVYPVADALAARGVPFMFATGYGRIGLDELYPDKAVLAKPYGAAALAGALAHLPRRAK